MSKAILVINMPERCYDCKFCYYSDGRVPICQWENMPIDEPKKIKPNWCPLQPPPERETYFLGMSSYSEGYVDGWNDCIDDILE